MLEALILFFVMSQIGYREYFPLAYSETFSFFLFFVFPESIDSTDSQQNQNDQACQMRLQGLGSVDQNILPISRASHAILRWVQDKWRFVPLLFLDLLCFFLCARTLTAVIISDLHRTKTRRLDSSQLSVLCRESQSPASSLVGSYTEYSVPSPLLLDVETPAEPLVLSFLSLVVGRISLAAAESRGSIEEREKA